MLSRKAHAADTHLQMDAVYSISIKVIHFLGIFGLIGKALQSISFLSPQYAEYFSLSIKYLTVFKTWTRSKLISKFGYYRLLLQCLLLLLFDNRSTAAVILWSVCTHTHVQLDYCNNKHLIGIWSLKFINCSLICH